MHPSGAPVRLEVPRCDVDSKEQPRLGEVEAVARSCVAGNVDSACDEQLGEVHGDRERRHHKHEAKCQQAIDACMRWAELVGHGEEHGLDGRPDDCQGFFCRPERVLRRARQRSAPREQCDVGDADSDHGPCRPHAQAEQASAQHPLSVVMSLFHHTAPPFVCPDSVAGPSSFSPCRQQRDPRDGGLEHWLS